MIYPEDFKERVKKAYPNNYAIQRALDTGDESLLNLLCDEHSKPMFSLNEIEKYSVQELREKRKLIEERSKIFTEFMDIYKNHILQKAKKG